MLKRSKLFPITDALSPRRSNHSLKFRPQSRKMSRSTTTDPQVPSILSFWFDAPNDASRWFSADLDEPIRSRYGSLVHAARTTALDHWSSTPDGALALLLLLDQFPRNIFRSTSDAYSSDAKAFQVATVAIADGLDRKAPPMRQPFFYLPLMHDENLLSQIACRSLYEGCLLRCGGDEVAKGFVSMGLGFGKAHLDVIKRFGRYPARNEFLGRENTEEEKAFLKTNPQGL